MSDYKSTLNLPNTDFPMKANLAQREPETLLRWKSEDIYGQIRNSRLDAKPFILHDGPPYANGHLHCGHALNKILKDMILKSKTLSGFNAPFTPGWDCHGLPIELNVEKKIGKAGHKVSAEEFREACRAYANSQIDIQRTEFQRLGVLGDWLHPYTTMSFSYEANIVRALAKIIEHGHLQQGFKPVHWCVDCRSALAEAEVDYEEKQSWAIDVAFQALDPQTWYKIFNINLHSDQVTKPVIVPIWTTTPWTLPANEAVCLNAHIEYALIETPDANFVVANELAESVCKRYGFDLPEASSIVLGKLLEKLKLQHPFYDKAVPVVLGDHVTTESGTGCVHTAPAHGVEDYWVGMQYQLPLINPVLGNGCYSDAVELFAGLSVFKAHESILERLKQNGKLLHQEKITHSYPHCWRHKSPMIFRATPQWFVSMENLREPLLAAIDTVEWIPEWGKARISGMVKDRPDWCVSRQRAWSTPMPLFVHKETRSLHPKTLEYIETIAGIIEQKGIEGWFSLDVQAFLGRDAEFYEKVNDTLDVWFDAGVSHFAVLKGQIADLYLEGSDQHRGWFNSSLTTAVAMYNRAPYKAVLTHGYTVDAQGRKLSKSLGNYVELDKIIAQYGADVLRLWVSSTDYRNEVAISDEILKRVSDTYRRIRNTARFLLANLFDFDPKLNSIEDHNWVKLDKWIVLRCKQLQDEIVHAYEAYQFHLIYQKIHHFCTIDLGSFYLDIIKDRQYTMPVNSIARRSCQTAMYHIIHALTRWIAPILSFTADEIWQHIPKKEDMTNPLFTELWYQDWPVFDSVTEKNDRLDELFTTLQFVRDEVNKELEKARQVGKIGSGLEAEVTIYAKKPLFEKISLLGSELRFLLITSQANIAILEHGDADMEIQIAAVSDEKCVRCWHRRKDVNHDQAHPGLCLRCVGNVSGQDEIRHFA